MIVRNSGAENGRYAGALASFVFSHIDSPNVCRSKADQDVLLFPTERACKPKKQKGASKLCRQLDVVKDRKSPKKIVCYLAITTICLGAQIEVHTRNRIYREKILVYIYYFPILNHIWRGGGVV